MVFIKKQNVSKLDQIECHLEINDECHLEINDEQKKQRIMRRRNIKIKQKNMKDELMK